MSGTNFLKKSACDFFCWYIFEGGTRPKLFFFKNFLHVIFFHPNDEENGWGGEKIKKNEKSLTPRVHHPKSNVEYCSKFTTQYSRSNIQSRFANTSIHLHRHVQLLNMLQTHPFTCYRHPPVGPLCYAITHIARRTGAQQRAPCLAVTHSLCSKSNQNIFIAGHYFTSQSNLIKPCAA